MLLFYRMIIFCVCLALGWADRLETLDGSVINGQFVKLDRGTVYFKTKFAGVLQVALSEVFELDVEKKQFLKLTDNGTKLRYLEFKNKEFVLLDPEQGKLETYIASDIAVAWPEGTEAPGALKSEESKWKRKVSGGVSKKSGNVNESSVWIGTEFQFKTDESQAKFYGNFYESNREGNISRSEKVAGYDFSNKYSQKNEWYIRQEVERDSIEDLRLRSQVATGLGHYVLDEKTLSLRLRLGFLHSHEDFRDKEDRDDPGADLGLSYKYIITDGVEFESNVQYLPLFGEESVYRAIHHSSLTLPWSFNVNWRFKFGVKHEYDSDPSSNNEELDTRYYTDLEVNF